MSALLDAAHDYRRRGWRVIQLHSVDEAGQCSCISPKRQTCPPKTRGKHPIDWKWQESPPLSAPDVEALWDMRPNANIGLAVGGPSGFWVLDIDPDGGGMESMRALTAEHGGLPQTFVVRTGSGGYHYYFKLPDYELRNTAGRIGPGIDTRADGGQVVAAPSKTAMGDYSIVTDLPIADAPDWLLEMARKPEVDPSTIVTAEDLPKPEDIEPAEWERLNAYANKAIDAECNRLRAMFKLKTFDPGNYRGEPWNLTTFEVACSLIEFANSPWCAYSLGQAKMDLVELAPRDQDFTDNDVEERWRSALNTVGDKARPMPEGRSSEPDPLFFGPDVVVRSSDPTEHGEGDAYPYRVLFSGDKGTTPQYKSMAWSVLDRGPVGWGHDHDFWSYEDGVWKPDHYVVQHRLIEILGEAYRTTHRTNTIDMVQKDAQPITGDPIEQMMNFRNGMLDWRQNTLVDHDPAYGSTVQLGTDWDASATCPTFDGFLHEILHEDYVSLAWEMIGYLMLSGNPLQVAFLFYGKGGNGKGTLINALELLLGKDNIASESLDDLSGNKFRTANLFGKIANLAGDIDATYQENTAMFKRITGEDMVTAEHKGLNPFRFENWAVPVFSANAFPGSSDVTEGYLRRWMVLHFDRHIKGEDVVLRPELMARFTNELPGIAAKGVASLRVLMERKEFNPQGKALEAKAMFAEEIDQVRKWLVSGDVIKTPGAMSPLINLYASYSLWAERSGHRKVRESEFLHRLEALEFEKKYDQGIPNVEGLTVHAGVHETVGGVY